MLTRTYLPTDLEVRSDGRTVTGIAAPFNTPTEIREFGMAFQEVIAPGAFARTIAERGPSKVKLLAQHDTAKLPLGRATMLREDPAGLYIEARISQTAAGDEALELIRDGALDSFSIGFSLPKDGERWDAKRQVRTLVSVKLHEVSLTPFPAYATASVQGLRHTAPPSYDPNLDPEFLRQVLRLRLNPLRKETL